jgi:hypothetical protein
LIRSNLQGGKFGETLVSSCCCSSQFETECTEGYWHVSE